MSKIFIDVRKMDQKKTGPAGKQKNDRVYEGVLGDFPNYFPSQK
jgi:hypothetical protein